MLNERWFPLNYVLPDGYKLGRLLYSGSEWQVYCLDVENSILIVRSHLANRWVESKLIPDTILEFVLFGNEDFRAICSGPGKRLEPVYQNKSPNTKADGLSFALSLRETRKISAEILLHDAIYVERYSRLLPTWTVSEASADEVVLGRWLTGGMSIPATSFRRLSSLLVWLSLGDLAELIKVAGFNIPQEFGVFQADQTVQLSDSKLGSNDVLSNNDTSEEESNATIHKPQFSLPGRPDLEAFLNEYVIDIIENPERYNTLGIEFPTAIVLYGPPGCGKTFAVERLVDYLDWPIFHIDSNSVGSPYIHETSRRVGEIFDQAMNSSPSMVIIDEMESYLSDRQIHESTGLHRVEEVAEFLRRIPDANKHHVLVIGMTNRLEMIDSAILRRGRFDHVVEVGMPSADDVSNLIDSLLVKLPIDTKLDTSEIVKSLSDRALSDTAFVVREAARLAARAGKNSLDEESLLQALMNLPPKNSEKSNIGFIRN